MKLFLSGEGPSDLGCCRNDAGLCVSPEFARGPLTALVDQVLEPVLGYRPSGIEEHCVFVAKAELLRHVTMRKRGRMVSLAGKKRDQETGYYYSNAWALGDIAIAQERLLGDVGIAILHRDNDDSNSSRATELGVKVKSIRDGFARAGYPRGVPMIPRPISEAWLLSIADPTIADAAEVEDLASNPAAPRPVKELLAAALGEKWDSESMFDWLDARDIDFERMRRMPSFAAFHHDVVEAVRACLAGNRAGTQPAAT